MNKNPFNASSWLQSNFFDKRPAQKAAPELSPSPSLKENISLNYKVKGKNFDIGQYFQSTSTNSVASHASPSATPAPHELKQSEAGLVLATAINKLKKDVLEQFFKASSFPKSFQYQLFNEFLAFSETYTYKQDSFDSPQIFWSYLNRGQFHNKYSPEIRVFLDEYFYKVACLYLHKIRFLIQLSYECQLHFSEKDVLNPNSFISQIFRKGSSTEIYSEALQSNHYTWYRPSPAYNSLLSTLIIPLKKISFFEFIALTMKDLPSFQNQSPGQSCSSQAQNQASTPIAAGAATAQSSSPIFSSPEMGQFIRLLLADLCDWGQNAEQETDFVYDLLNKKNRSETTTCKIVGNQIESLALAFYYSEDFIEHHDEYLNKLTADFFSETRNHSFYFKTCLEFQFLVSNIKRAKNLGQNPIQYLAKKTKSKVESLTFQEDEQIDLFRHSLQDVHCKYDRIYLNVTKFPKNNPNFFLLHQIHDQLKDLKAHGKLIVLSSKKLFIPSQKDKIEALLKQLKLECYLTLDQLKNKSNLTPYIYIFSRKKSQEFIGAATASMDHSHSSYEQYLARYHQKESCLSFRLSGELQSGQDLYAMIYGVKNFLKLKDPHTTTLYQSELKKNVSLEFYHDSVIDGKLIHSSNKDSTQITHPNYFKNLMKSCSPLDHFFFVESLDPESEEKVHSKTRDHSNLLGLTFEKQDQFPFILILDFRSDQRIRLDIIPRDSFKAKAEEYGHALCFYYGLTPKAPYVNVNLVREFFQHSIGNQVLQFALTGAPTKLKAKVSSLLIPKFVEVPDELPGHFMTPLAFLECNVKDLLTMGAGEIGQSFERIKNHLAALLQKYPWSMGTVLTCFLNNLREASHQTQHQFQLYNHPFFVSRITQVPAHAIFPNNRDVFIKFFTQNARDMNHALERFEIVQSGDLASGAAAGKSYQLNLFAQNKLMLSFHAHKEYLDFIAFILQATRGVPLMTLLKAIKIPEYGQLKTILEDFGLYKQILSELILHIEKSLGQLIIFEISREKN